MKGGYCMDCGEYIPVAIPIPDGPDIGKCRCCECAGEPLGHHPTTGGDYGAKADMQYHGGRFYSGEW